MGMFDDINMSGVSAATAAAQDKLREEQKETLERLERERALKQERASFVKDAQSEAREKLKEANAALGRLRLEGKEGTEEYKNLEQEVKALEERMEGIIRQEADKRFGSQG
jgi:Fe-S cluster assembly scaffold protein SufB